MKKYLQRNHHDFPLEPLNSSPPDGDAVVIPVFDENENIYATLAALKKAIFRAKRPVSAVLVINDPVSASDSQRENNRKLADSLRKNDGKYDGGLDVGKELFFIDLTDKEIKEKHRTVGNARKVGFDGFLLQSDGEVTDQKRLFFSLDADTLVEENYLSSAYEYFEKHPDSAGAVFEFAHRLENTDHNTNMAALRYEYYLRDYVKKLDYCRSAYNFWTIGSAFCCTMRNYVRCGGMRRNAAGEDFYFLQALRKVGVVGKITTTCVHPAGRVSGRVPFGTGPAIAKQLSGTALGLYNQKCFEPLKIFFERCNQADYDILQRNIEELAPELLSDFLKTLNFASAWQKIVQNTPRQAEKLQNALQIYCDGFFILKFCHYLEELDPENFAREALPPDEAIPALISELKQSYAAC